jgi:hypothetical protein
MLALQFKLPQPAFFESASSISYSDGIIKLGIIEGLFLLKHKARIILCVEYLNHDCTIFFCLTNVPLPRVFVFNFDLTDEYQYSLIQR